MATRFPSPPVTDSDSDPPRGRTRKRRSSTTSDIIDHNHHSAKILHMDSEAAQAAPTTQRPRFQQDSTFNVPRLSPSKSPARPSRPRSISPSKQQEILRNAFPKTTWSTTKSHIPNGPAFDLQKKLIEASRKGFFPATLRATLSEQEKADFLDPNEPFSATLTEMDLPKIKGILSRAESCYNDGQDEAAWCRVVDSLLELALVSTSEDGTPSLEVLDTRTQAPSNMWLPYASADREGAHASKVPSKKSDFSLAFHRHSERVRKLSSVAGVPGSNEVLPLSHSSDRFTSTVPLQCTVEVKKEDGGHLEARTQLSTWHSAAMCHIRYLATGSQKGIALPAELIQIGWLVIGHKWEPCMSFVTPEGDHVTVGPLFVADMGTADLLSVYRLLAVLRSQTDWLLQVYWSAFAGIFSTAVARLDDRSVYQ